MRPGPVALVDHDDVGHLQQAGLDRLDLVAHLGRLDDDRRVGRGGHLDLALARADGLDQDRVEARGVEDSGRGRGRRRESAGVAARRHGADEDAVVGGVGLHPDAVAQDGAAGDRAGRIDRDDGHRPPGAAQLRDQRRHERALARAGRPGDADQLGAAGQRVEAPQRGLGDRRPVLDRGQQPRQRAAIARQGRVAQIPRRAP